MSDSARPSQSEDQLMSSQKESGRAEINGNQIHYEEYGEGTPLVFIHGAFNTCDMWRPQIERLSRRNRLIVYDLPGHGRSGPTRGRFSMDNLARDLDALLGHLEVASAVVCGFSLGGCVAQEYAWRHPAKLRGLIVSDSIGGSLAGPARGLARSAVRLSTPFVSRRRMLGLAGFATSAMQKDVQEYFMRVAGENLKRMSKREILEIATSLIDFRGRDLSRFDKPALIIAGAREPRRILKEARRLVARIPAATLEVIEDAQHGPNRENPAAFNAAIGRLLERAEAVDLPAAS